MFKELIATLDESKFSVTENKILKKDQAVVMMATELESNPENSALLHEIQTQTNKGLSVYFKIGEKIAFPTWDKMPIKTVGFETSNGKLSPICSTWAVSDRPSQGTFEFHMSIFRRIPTDIKVDLEYDGDRVIKSYVYDDETHSRLILEDRNIKTVESHEFLLNNNPVGEVLAKRMDDFARCRYLAGKVIECIDKVSLFRPYYENGSRVWDKYERITIYKWKIVE